VSRRVRTEASLEIATDQWLDLYREVLQTAVPTHPTEPIVLRRLQRRWRSARRFERMAQAGRRLRATPIVGEAGFQVIRWFWRAAGRPGSLVTRQARDKVARSLASERAARASLADDSARL
jgi:hypothetical protein